MDKTLLEDDVRAMIAEAPVTLAYTDEDGNAQTVSAGQANMRIGERMANAGRQASIEMSVWTIKSDWTTADIPEKRKLVTVDGLEYRVVDVVDYYMDVARRLDLGDKYEQGVDVKRRPLRGA